MSTTIKTTATTALPSAATKSPVSPGAKSPVSASGGGGTAGEKMVQYSRELVLSLYRPNLPLPPHFQPHPEVLRVVREGGESLEEQQPWKPVSLLPLTEAEKKILESGNVNSEVSSRRWNSGQRQPQGQQQQQHAGPRQPGQRQQQQRGGLGGTGGNATGAGGGNRVGARAGNRPSFSQTSAGVDNNNNSQGETAGAPLSDDIWDLPKTQGSASGGSFANGAFTMGGAGSAAAKPAVPNVWRQDAGRSGNNAAAQQQPSRAQSSMSSAGMDPWNARTPTQEMPLVEQHLSMTRMETAVRTQVPPGPPPGMAPLPEPIWLYKDPHGNVQGPFSAREMTQWFEAGYFPQNLLVKQTTDPGFEELAMYMSRYGGRVQFHIPRPVVQQPSQTTLSSLHSGMGVPAQQQHQQSLAMGSVHSGDPAPAPDPRISSFDAIFGRAQVPSQSQMQPTADPMDAAWNAPRAVAVDRMWSRPPNTMGSVADPAVSAVPRDPWNRSPQPQHQHSAAARHLKENEASLAVRQTAEVLGSLALTTPSPPVQQEPSPVAEEPQEEQDVPTPTSASSATTWQKTQLSATEKPQSLRDIQEAEQREQARRLAEQERRAKEAQRQAAAAGSQSPKEPSIPLAWASAAAKKPAGGKSLLQIQQEEKKILENKAAAEAGITRRYAETAGKEAPKSAWALGKSAAAVVASSAVVAPVPASLAVKASAPAGVVPSTSATAAKRASAVPAAAPVVPAPSKESNAIVDFSRASKPSEAFLAWCREQLRPLSTRIDVSSFLELVAPLTDPETINEVIYDVIGANFDLVNPKDFVQQYLQHRKQDARLQGKILVPGVPAQSAYADYLRQQREKTGTGAKPSGGPGASSSSHGASSDKGFVQVVKKKKAKKPSTGERQTGAPVGVGGRTVVGATHP